MTVTIILIILSFYLLAKASESNQRKRAAKRAEAERARRQAEIKRIQEEQRKAEQERRAMARWRVECDREMLRIAQQQEREEKARLKAEEEQRRINEKLEREQRKQAEQIAKQELRLKALEQKRDLAARDEEHWTAEYEAVLIDVKGLEAYIRYMKERGLPCSAKETELKKLQGKLYGIETKALKAKQSRELCEMQMHTV